MFGRSGVRAFGRFGRFGRFGGEGRGRQEAEKKGDGVHWVHFEGARIR
jgi:hypothetical protein